MTGPVGRTSRNRPSLAARLGRAGVREVERTERLLADPALTAVVPETTDLPGLLGEVADPDLAALGLVKVAEAVRSDPAAKQARTALTRALTGPGSGAARLLAVLGASSELGNFVVTHPCAVRAVLDDAPAVGVDPRTVRAELLAAVGADPDADLPVAAPGGSDGVDAMRVAYRTRLARIAAADLVAADPLGTMPEIAAALADLAAAALEAALALARAELDDHGAGVRLAVIGMGKCGGRELNYVSDVDVVYVAEPRDGTAEDEAMAVGTRLAASLARACSAVSGEPALWPVDAALRPEGKDGPLVRTLASHRTYYERWARTWEFQALLKARPLAGDAALGRAYVATTQPLVWSAVTREHFVEDSQAMRRRVEAHLPRAEADRQIKLGVGGLRDVEFTVQLLQLVHGRADETIRSGTTLTALAALAAGGYVGRDHAAQLAQCYRFLRVLEHRLQLTRMQRTHLLPTAPADLERLARSVGMRVQGAAGLTDRWRSVQRDVRRLHEEVFYRPLLPATAQLSTDEARLAPEAAQARLAAIGYRDPTGAVRHIAALTEGLSRRAAIQRQLLPVMLGWFADGADPDAGLLAFRLLSDTLGSTHWYLKLLRDSGSAAQRLSAVLSTSRYVAEALTRSPKSVMWLGDDAELEPRSFDRLWAEAEAILRRTEEPAAAALALRGLRRRELARAASAQVLGQVTLDRVSASVTVAADVLLAGGLRIARHQARQALGLEADPAQMAVVAMGRLGGAEMSYSSDADIMYVYDPGADETLAQEWALQVATGLRALLVDTAAEPPLELDTDLRPEGRNGPLVRTLAAYEEYYERWSSVWEAQALLRARPVAGDPGLGEQFVALADPVRYPAGGLSLADVREIRRIKARVEGERLPRGVEPARHVKLGPGGLADVEWTAQLYQLRHAHEVPALRTTSTRDALAAAGDAGLLDRDDVEVLRTAWELALRVRDANTLWSGRTDATHVDQLPHDRRTLAGVARVMGYGPGGGAALEEEYLRSARRARAVVERVFYG
ncbi:MAG: bifunctional [glutamine synthetase] adenylyltransferase/[glutamine synthetase]-adenylyl-L-tyrosine phosphorylase [Micrococcales bacterium]|nr:bifunctional [glutamine synthetase] adenylyltransferase/[glutamine synthetase]-adenylyl-L-tyrosine phosphorylase [Micrococcales bacterium]